MTRTSQPRPRAPRRRSLLAGAVIFLLLWLAFAEPGEVLEDDTEVDVADIRQTG